MKRYIIALTAIISIILFSLSLLLSYIDFNNHKSKIAERFYQQYNCHLLIKGDIKLKFSPIPYFSITSVFIENAGEVMLYVQELQAKITLADLLKFSDIINSIGDNIILKDGFIATEQVYIKIQNQKDLSLKKLKTTNITLENLNLRYCCNSDKLNLINNINIENLNILLGPDNISVNGSFSYHQYQKLLHDLQISLVDLNEKQSPFQIKISGQGMEFYSQGLVKIKEKIFGQGKLKYKISDIYKVADYFHDSNRASQELSKKDYKPLILSADFYLSSNDLMRIYNFSSHSNVIRKIEGEAVIDLANIEMININSRFNIGYIDFDNFLDFTTIDSQVRREITTSMLAALYKNFRSFLPKSLISYLNFTIDEVILFGKKVSTVHLSPIIVDGKMILDDLSMKLPGDSNLELKGLAANNKIRTKFDGKASFTSSDFDEFNNWSGLQSTEKIIEMKHINVIGEISMIPMRLRFNNIDINIDGLPLKGDVFFAKNGYGNHITDLSLFCQKFHFDKINFDQEINKLLYLLYSNDYNNRDDSFYLAVNNYNWLRDMNDSWHGEIYVDELVLSDDNSSIKDGKLIFDLNKNNFNIRNISLKSKDLELDGSISLTLPAFRALVSGNLNIEKINASKFASLFHQKVTNLATKWQKTKNDSYDQAVKDFNFFSAANYDADIKTQIANMTFDDGLQISELNSDLQLNDGVISLQSDFYGMNGKTAIKSNIIIGGVYPQANGTFMFDSIDPNKLLYYLTNMNKINGYMSISGNFLTHGGSINSFLRNMEGNVIFAGKMIKWNGIGFNKVIEAVDANYSIEDKRKQIDYYTQYGTTVFDDMSGNFTINNGIATFPAVKLSNERLSGVFAGNYDIVSGNIKSHGIVSFIPMNYTSAINLGIQSSGITPQIKTELNLSDLMSFIDPNYLKKQNSNVDLQSR